MNKSKSTVVSVLLGLTLIAPPLNRDARGQAAPGQSLPPAEPVPPAAPAPRAPVAVAPAGVTPPAASGAAGFSGRYGSSSGGISGGYGGGGIGGGGYGGGGYGGGGGGVALGDLPGMGNRFVTIGKRDSVPSLVVDFTSADPLVLQQMEEDLTVMSHLLDQALERGLGEEAPPSKMGVPLVYTSSGRSVRGMYLEGFGALFTVKVNMPLLAPPAASQEKPVKSTDSEWESARREVLGSDASGDNLTGSSTGSDTPFDAEQVEALKRNLTAALKNASNIRHLKPDDYVSVAVFGQPTAQSGSGTTFSNMNIEFHSSPDQNFENFPATPKPSATGVARAKSGKRSATVTNGVAGNTRTITMTSGKGSVLTLRVKNSDVSALAAGNITAEEFAKKVATLAYPGSGYGAASVNSWVRGRP